MTDAVRSVEKKTNPHQSRESPPCKMDENAFLLLITLLVVVAVVSAGFLSGSLLLRNYFRIRKWYLEGEVKPYC